MRGLYFNPVRLASTRAENRATAAVGIILALAVLWFLLVTAHKFTEGAVRHFCDRANGTNITVCV